VLHAVPEFQFFLLLLLLKERPLSSV